MSTIIAIISISKIIVISTVIAIRTIVSIIAIINLLAVCLRFESTIPKNVVDQMNNVFVQNMNLLDEKAMHIHSDKCKTQQIQTRSKNGEHKRRVLTGQSQRP